MVNESKPNLKGTRLISAVKAINLGGLAVVQCAELWGGNGRICDNFT